MNDDIEYLIERLDNQAGTNICIVSYNDKCCKIARENYHPDENGKLVMKAETDWCVDGFSVAELIEVLKMYSNKIKDIEFEIADGSVFKLLNVFEVDNIGNVGEFNCLIIVGEPGRVLKLYNNPDNENYMTSTLGRMY